MWLRTAAGSFAASLDIAVAVLAAATRGPLDAAAVDARIAAWASRLLELAQAQLDVHGGSLIDPSRSYLVMSNHQSLYDIPVLFRALPLRLRMVAKQELFRVPIWGQAMRAAGFIAIDRRDRRRAIAALGETRELLRAGQSYWLAPEGTRSADGRLLPFKRGGFHTAIQASAPILPVSIDGVRELYAAARAGRPGPHVVRVTVGRPIETAGRGRRDVDALMAEVRRAIGAPLGQGA